MMNDTTVYMVMSQGIDWWEAAFMAVMITLVMVLTAYFIIDYLKKRGISDAKR
jgi:hypothetical protein